MSKDKAKLLKFLEKRHYANLPEKALTAKSGKKSSFKAESKKATEKKKVEAIKRFQKFSGLQTTGRVNKATLLQTERASCSFPDVSTGELMAHSFSPPRWDTTSIRYGFRNFTDQIPRTEIKDEVKRAFDKWTGAFSDFDFRRVEIHQHPLIVISFETGSHTDGFPFGGSGGDLAHAFPPNDPHAPGQIHFDDDESWSISPSGSEKDLFTVTVHEIGHALGLGHSGSEDSWMFKDYIGVRTDFNQEDIDNITNLYG